VNLPFTPEQFFAVFADYNRALWPVVVALWLSAFGGVLLLATSRKGHAPLMAAMLAVQWAWAGLAYHALFFSRINPVAWLFAGLFLIQALLFWWFGVVRQQMHFSPTGSPRHVLAWALIGYALIYPLIVAVEGHTLPKAPTFGVPCPTTLLTIGFLFAADPPWPRAIAVIPLLWAIIGGSAAVILGVRTDWLLWVAAVALMSRLLSLARTSRLQAASATFSRSRAPVRPRRTAPPRTRAR